MPIKVSWDGKKYKVETWGKCGVLGEEEAQRYFIKNKDLIKYQMTKHNVSEFVCDDWYDHASQADVFDNEWSETKFYLKHRTKEGWWKK